MDKLRLTGRVLSGYRIEEPLGEGGMGVVYRATDVRLNRPAVLKFLLQSAGSHSQLMREAQAAAALNHPNICTVYGVGEEEGYVFIAMEFLDGTNLRKITRCGPLAWTQAVSICRQAASALQAAHARGIVHRDVKSSNIFVTRDGTVKLLDFGIAARRDDPDETQTIFWSGTPDYMSPEQLEAGTADARSDIWALGVVLYEMATGHMPFGGEGKSSLRSILTEEPAMAGTLVSGVPPELDAIITRALTKDARERYSGAVELIADLDRLHDNSQHAITMHSTARIARPLDPKLETRVIAVLPFANLSSDPNDEYICDGLAEELINGLTHFPGLRVVSRASSFQFKGTSPDVRELGRTLRATHLVHGSLRRAGDRLRLTAQLSEARNGYQLWSQRFDAGMKDLFTLQDELSAAVLEKLRLRLGPPSDKPGRRNPVAHDLYLRARYYFNRQTAEGLKQAIEHLARALELDSEDAASHIAMAECHAALEWYGIESAHAAIPKVKASLEAGLRSDPNSMAGLCLLATVEAGYDWNWTAAEQTFRSAMSRGAGYAPVLFHYALDLLTPLGRLEEALDTIRSALDLDPVSAITSTALGGCYYRLRRYTEAASSLRSTLELNPNFGHAHWSLGRTLLEIGENTAALDHFDEATRIVGRTHSALAERAYGLARSGRAQDARQILGELESSSCPDFVSPVNLALVLAGLGDVEAAIAALERALETRTRQIIWVNVDPRFDNLRGEAGFESLLSRMGLSIPAAVQVKPFEVRM